MASKSVDLNGPDGISDSALPLDAPARSIFKPASAPSEAEERLIVRPQAGIRYGGPEARSKNIEHGIYAATKNIGAIAGVIWAITQPTSWVEWTGFAVFYVMNILSMSLGYHRYFTHKAFETSKPMRYALAILAQLGVYGSLLRWSADHRRHHALADQPGDVHSPYYDGHGNRLSGMKGWRYSQLGWVFDDVTSDYAIYGKGLADDPAILFAHRTRSLWYMVTVFVLPTIWALAWGRPDAIIGSCLIAGFLRANIALHAIAGVNSFGHIFGRQRYVDGKDQSRNNWIIAILTLGEGWHNNHHAHPRAANAGMAWYEVDMTAWVIRFMEKLGLVWNVRWAKLPGGGRTTV